MNTPHRPDQDQKRAENQRTVATHMAQHSDQPTSKSSTSMTGFKRWGTLGVALVFILGKFKWVLLLSKYAKLPTLLSMLAAVWVYASIWGFAFALGFVLLIFVHEMGHAVAMRQQKIPAGAPVFIPFVGAVIAMKKRPRDAYVEAVVGIGGPALGTLGAVACLAVAWIGNDPFWYALASTGFLINLFNMLPIPPLYGGRIAGVLGRWIWVVGLAIGAVVFIKIRSPLLFLILIIGGVNLFCRISKDQAAYYHVHAAKRVMIGTSYFGLLVIMALGMWFASGRLDGLL